MATKPEGPLRKGWTTGACATAATAAAFEALATGRFPDPVTITLPGGKEPAFPLVRRELGEGEATASVIKDAGDDPDITHGAEIVVSVRWTETGEGISFRAGEGVGTVTKPGLPIPPGEPAINPKPREMMTAAIADLARRHGCAGDVAITVGVTDGATLAEATWNPRLGIEGGLSILGTTGVVIPYSCSAWIHSIHRGIDVARATGLNHVAVSTGRTSEVTVRELYGLEIGALIDMGDFAGGMLKYLRRHPVPRVTIAGGFGKLTKLGQGAMDLHSSRSQVNHAALAALAEANGADATLVSEMAAATSAGAVLALSQAHDIPLADAVARRARESALATLAGDTVIDIIVIDRAGAIVGRAGP
ncbi:MAG: cobalt-precorrin-5B (C(1))-methyltransferase [Rhodospirillales bacterium]|nr:cobalt-precorrin-5B (C(1))-methyltransferase [Rhodospirillales bacterium]